MIGNRKRANVRNTKRWFVAVGCTLLLVVGLFLWSPWSANQDGSEATQDVVSGTQDVTDETNDSNTQAEDEEWPGQSLGYVGPNGEGALKDYDYETAEEYTALIEDVFNGGWENYVERETVSDSDGEYVEGFLLVWFECSEYDAHEIAEKHGAVWVQDSYMYMEEANERVLVTLYFSNAQDREDLEEIAEILCTENGVGGAELIDVVGVLASDSEVVTAEVSL